MTARSWAVLAALAAAACSKLQEPPSLPTAILHVYAQPGGVGQLEAVFVGAPPAQFPDSRSPGGACQLADLANLPVGTVSNVDAGDSVAFISDSGTAYLYPTFDPLGNESYVPATSLVRLTPGTAVSFVIPGAAGGFPATSFTAITAAEITQLTFLPGSDSMVVTWGPAGDDSSSFEVALQYGTEDATTANRQVLCQWRDGGKGVIPGGLLAEWTTAVVRRIAVSRYRTFREDLAGGEVLFFLATYDLTPDVGP